MNVDGRIQANEDAEMRGVYQFLKSTILGGLVVLLPLVAVSALIVWAVETCRKALMPVLVFE